MCREFLRNLLIVHLDVKIFIWKYNKVCKLDTTSEPSNQIVWEWVKLKKRISEVQVGKDGSVHTLVIRNATR